MRDKRPDRFGIDRPNIIPATETPDEFVESMRRMAASAPLLLPPLVEFQWSVEEHGEHVIVSRRESCLTCRTASSVVYLAADRDHAEACCAEAARWFFSDHRTGCKPYVATGRPPL